MMGLQALKRPKSDMTIIRGLKSRDKTVAITGFDLRAMRKYVFRELESNCTKPLNTRLRLR
jgi:uncharacterized protein YggU (UPF0235/DUF167 family)